MHDTCRMPSMTFLIEMKSSNFEVNEQLHDTSRRRKLYEIKLHACLSVLRCLQKSRSIKSYKATVKASRQCRRNRYMKLIRVYFWEKKPHLFEMNERPVHTDLKWPPHPILQVPGWCFH